jgi:hypothetical protein
VMYDKQYIWHTADTMLGSEKMKAFPWW